MLLYGGFLGSYILELLSLGLFWLTSIFIYYKFKMTELQTSLILKSKAPYKKTPPSYKNKRRQVIREMARA